LKKKNSEYENEQLGLKKRNEDEVNGLKRKIAELENELKKKNLSSSSSSSSLFSFSSTDTTTPLANLIWPNPHGRFKLEGRNIIFEGNFNGIRSVILKEGILDGILEVFVLVTLTFEVIMIILFVFIFHKGR
jgi:hypothetical protein